MNYTVKRFLSPTIFYDVVSYGESDYGVKVCFQGDENSSDSGKCNTVKHLSESAEDIEKFVNEISMCHILPSHLESVAADYFGYTG